MGYTDIHTHILPGVDDGSISLEQSMLMLHKAFEEDIRRIYLTPHYIPGRRNASKEHRLTAFEELRAQALKELPDLELYLGNEIYYRENALSDLKAGEAFTMADTDYVLLEFDIHSDYKILQKAVKQFTEAGYKPILAHIERYDALFKQAERVEELIDAGAAIQVNADSLRGGLLHPVAKFCKYLLKNDLIHFLGSDCHNLNHRPPLMETALKGLYKNYGQNLDRIMNRNVQKLVKNEWM